MTKELLRGKINMRWKSIKASGAGCGAGDIVAAVADEEAAGLSMYPAMWVRSAGIIQSPLRVGEHLTADTEGASRYGLSVPGSLSVCLGSMGE